MTWHALKTYLLFSPDWKIKLVRALIIGAIGAAIAVYLHVPLAFMLGAMAATLVGSISGARIAVPMKLRTAGIGVLGMYLGSTFSPAMMDQAAEWPVTLASIILFVPLVTALTALFYRFVARYDRVTAIYAAAPGALTPMIILGSSAGGHEQTIAMTQGLRVMLLVFAAPFLLALIGLDAVDSSPLQAVDNIDLVDFTILSVACLAGVFIAQKINLPATQMTGSMLVSGALYLGGLVDGALPVWFIDAVLLIMGASIGSRFAGVDRRFLTRVAGFSILSVGLIMLYSAAAAMVVSWMTGLDYLPVLLAMAPGGVAEMCLIAVGLGIDPGFVAFHHIARIFAILLLAPLVGWWLKRLQSGATGQPPSS